jgi:imidazolonepropionase-like amidohydrolase
MTAILLVAVLSASPVTGGESARALDRTARRDLDAARALFEANLDAIRKRDAGAYRACYRDSPFLVRSGPDGPTLGLESFVAPSAGEWPEALDAYDLRLVPVRDGVVYGSYRYRVVFAGVPSEGLSERLFIRTPQGWKIAITTAFPAPPGTPPPPLALVGGTIVDGSGGPGVPDGVLLMRDARIECVGTRAECPVPEGVDIRNVDDTWVVPGLVDAHVHFSQTGWVDGRPDAVDLRETYPYEEAVAWLQGHVADLFRTYLYSGVTAVLDVGGYPWTWTLQARAEEHALAPHVAATGPLLTTWVPEILTLPEQTQFVLMADEAAIERAVRSHAAFGADAIKVWFIVRRDDDFAELAKKVEQAGATARELGLPLVVHATGLEHAKVALRAGAKILVHGVDDQPVDEEFLDLARRNGSLCTPTLTVLEGYRSVYQRRWDPAGVPIEGVDAETLRRARATVDIPDDRLPATSLDAVMTRLDSRQKMLAENTRFMHRAGVRLALGTDAGNPLTLHGVSVFKELEAMEAAGLSPAEVLIAATAHGAVALGRDDIGVLEAGRIADALILDANPLARSSNFRRIQAIVRRGTWHERSQLRALATR